MAEALDTIREDVAVIAFERLFAERGCLKPFVPTVGSPSPVLVPSSICQNSPSGG